MTGRWLGERRCLLLVHLLSGKFTVNGAWLLLATITLGLERAIGTLAGTDLGKAPSGTIRRVVTVAARIAAWARKITWTCPLTGPGKPAGHNFEARATKDCRTLTSRAGSAYPRPRNAPGSRAGTPSCHRPNPAPDQNDPPHQPADRAAREG